MVAKLHSLFFQVVKAGQAKQREEQMRAGGAGAVQSMQTPAVTAEGFGAAELGKDVESVEPKSVDRAAATAERLDAAEKHVARRRMRRHITVTAAVEGTQTPAVTSEEIAAVELDAQDEKLLGQLEQEAAARGEAFAPAEEREKFKVTRRACEHI